MSRHELIVCQQSIDGVVRSSNLLLKSPEKLDFARLDVSIKRLVLPIPQPRFCQIQDKTIS